MYKMQTNLKNKKESLSKNRVNIIIKIFQKIQKTYKGLWKSHIIPH